jgi:hypothetical protein
LPLSKSRKTPSRRLKSFRPLLRLLPQAVFVEKPHFRHVLIFKFNKIRTFNKYIPDIAESTRDSRKIAVETTCDAVQNQIAPDKLLPFGYMKVRRNTGKFCAKSPFSITLHHLKTDTHTSSRLKGNT